VSPVKYELGFYIPEDGILLSHRRESLKSQNSDVIPSQVHCFSVAGKAFSVLKTHTSVLKDVNGELEGHSETREEGQYTHVIAGC
jgi:hypothetical protein